MSTDWGVGSQIYCFTNGRKDVLLIPEYFWQPVKPGDLAAKASITGKNIAYLVSNATKTHLSKTEVALNDFRKSPLWKEVEVENQVKNWTEVKINKFILSGRNGLQKEKAQ